MTPRSFEYRQPTPIPSQEGYPISVFEAPPVSCRGGARFPATIPDWIRIPLPRPFSPQSRRRRDWGEKGRGRGRWGCPFCSTEPNATPARGRGSRQPKGAKHVPGGDDSESGPVC